MLKSIGLILLAAFMTIVFLLSGLTINLLQAILYLALYNRNRSLYRKINYYLIYTTWTQILCMAEWWSGSTCDLWGDEESLKHFAKEHCIIVMNHKYDVDWVMTWLVCEKMRMLANAKACAKKELKKVPIIGWGWIFGEMIFLERSWEKDRPILEAQLNSLVEYEDPIMILYFCEGTRFTPEKHKASIEFAKSRNLPQLKHHLCPRTSGFTFSATCLKDKIASVYCVQLGFPDTPIKPTFSSMLRGHSFHGDIHVRRIPMSQVPTESTEAASKFLFELYQEKDRIMDEYLKTNKFPGRCIKLKRSYRTLFNTVFWSVVVGFPFLYLLFKLLTMGSVLVTSVTVSVIVLLFTAMYLMIRATKASKGSSYGKDKSPAKSNNGAPKPSSLSSENDASVSAADEAGVEAEDANEQGVENHTASNSNEQNTEGETVSATNELNTESEESAHSIELNTQSQKADDVAEQNSGSL